LAEPPPAGRIYVLAGVNGSGKSSVLGETFRAHGAEFFNPDAATAMLVAANPGLSYDAANSRAWLLGRTMLETAIERGGDFAFETTLGGTSITHLLERALSLGREVYMLYIGLAGPEAHIARVSRRVAGGGHDIPAERIRRRYETSRLNLVTLLPRLTGLRVFDNSEEADPARGAAPAPLLILHTAWGEVVHCIDLHLVPEWAKPIVAAALREAAPPG
jgi:predicted ABC-type ATPase